MTDRPTESRRAGIPPFHVMEVMREAAAREATGAEVLHLEVGQPSTAAPQAAIEAARAALDTDVLGYTAALGRPSLRARIARWYREERGVEVDPEQVVVTTGASGSCVLAFHALFDIGARVGVLEPGYPCYRNDLLAFGIDPVPIPIGPETDYRPTVDLLDAAGPLDGLVLASPSNPTGTVLAADDLAPLLTWAEQHGVPVVLDEIYQGLEYGSTPAPTMAGHPGVVVFNSMSKLFSMTGWRLGWIVAPPPLVAPLERLAQNLAISAPTISQVAAEAAFDDVEERRANIARYAANRAVLLERLPAMGLDRFAPPDGAFYVWLDVGHLLDERIPHCRSLVRHWLDDLGVAATPGVDFDPPRGDRFVRLSYAGATPTIVTAMDRLADWLASSSSAPAAR